VLSNNAEPTTMLCHGAVLGNALSIEILRAAARIAMVL
jgi:hypothetical protein